MLINKLNIFQKFSAAANQLYLQLISAEPSELDRAQPLQKTKALGLSNGAYGIGGHLIGS